MYKGTVKSLFVILVYLSNNHNTHTHTHTHTRYKVTFTSFHKSFPGGSDCKESRAMQATQVQFLGWEDPLEKGMATHSSTVAYRIPWTEEPGELQSMGPQSWT